MKRIISGLLVLSMLFVLAACANNQPATPATPDAPVTPQAAADTPAQTPATADTPAPATADGETFPGKIAIVTNTVDQNEEEYRSAEALQIRFGTDKVIHRTWPVNFASEGEMMISILQEIVSDPDVKAIVINQAVINTNAAVDKVRELRGDDIFIVYASPAEDPADVAARADLLFDVNNPLVGERYVMQAKALGAETIAHYSFPRHMSVPLLAMRRDIMRQTAEREGLAFVELVAPDPMGDGGQPATQMHIAQDIPRQVETLGVNTSFFGSNCGMQIPMITQVIATGAIYAQPCCPSPYHGFPVALGIADKIPTGQYNENGDEIMALRSLSEVVEATRVALAARGVAGRLSTWAVPASMLWTTAGALYAIEWINGNVPTEPGNLDMDMINRISAEYIYEVTGERIGVDLVPLELDGRTFSHFLLGVVDYLTY